jgi:hypothetical protein
MSTHPDSNHPASPLECGGASRSTGAEVAVFWTAWHDFRKAWAALVIYAFFFKLLEAWLLIPILAVVLSAALSQAGRVAVSNRDILDFLRSPPCTMRGVWPNRSESPPANRVPARQGGTARGEDCT